MAYPRSLRAPPRSLNTHTHDSLAHTQPRSSLTQLHLYHLLCTGTGNTNADATGAQLVALQRMLERLMYGKISRVELNWTQQLIVGYSDTVAADRWKAALPHMFVWIDYACIPQPSCKIALHQSLIPQEISSCQGSFFQSFR